MTEESSAPSGARTSASLYAEALATFTRLLDEARLSGDREPTAMTLATSDANGKISARIVLLKGIDEHGFRFFSNYESAKGRQLAEHAQVALCFHWKSLRDQVQVRVEGNVQKLPPAESDAYYATRARGSQIGAWASKQSRTLPDRATFDARVAEIEQRFASNDVPRPPHWGGYLVTPQLIEFWYGANFRLHERVCYACTDGRWIRRLLYP